MAARADGPNVVVTIQDNGVPLNTLAPQALADMSVVQPFELVRESNERWVDPTDMDPLQIGENDVDAVPNSDGDGDGDGGGAARPGVGSGFWVDGDDDWVREGRTGIIQSPDTDINRHVQEAYLARNRRRSDRAMEERRRRAEERQRSRNTVERWKARFPMSCQR